MRLDSDWMVRNSPAVFALLAESACIACQQPALEHVCSDCAWELARPMRALDHRGTLFSGAWALGDYAGVVGQLVRRAKFADDDGAASTLVDAFAGGIGRCLPRVDALVPIGTTPWRRAIRGMHLPDLAASALAAKCDIPIVPALRRTWTGSQTRRSHADRALHAARAFRSVGSLTGRVLLVDDVLTTGSTAHAAAAELLSMGASAVFLAVLAASGNPPPARIGIA